MERLRPATVTVEIDTNKTTDSDVLTPGEHDEGETVDEFVVRARDLAREFADGVVQ